MLPRRVREFWEWFFGVENVRAMVERVKEQALEMELTGRGSWERGIHDLHTVAEREDGAFCCTFFKAIGIN